MGAAPQLDLTDKRLSDGEGEGLCYAGFHGREDEDEDSIGIGNKLIIVYYLKCGVVLVVVMKVSGNAERKRSKAVFGVTLAGKEAG